MYTQKTINKSEYKHLLTEIKKKKVKIGIVGIGYVGLKPAEGLYLLIARLGLVYYFGFFFIISPFIHLIEKTKELPASISDVYLGRTK